MSKAADSSPQVLNEETPRTTKTKIVPKSKNSVQFPQRMSLRNTPLEGAERSLGETLSPSRCCGTRAEEPTKTKKLLTPAEFLLEDAEQGLDENLSCSRGSETPTGEPTQRRKLPSRQSLRAGKKEDPKLVGILRPVVSLERLSVNYATETVKKEIDLWAPLNQIGNASNSEIAATLGVPRGQLDKMSVSQLLVRLRKDKPTTATRQKGAEPSNSDNREINSPGRAQKRKSDSPMPAPRRITRLSCSIYGTPDGTPYKDVDEPVEKGRRLRNE